MTNEIAKQVALQKTHRWALIDEQTKLLHKLTKQLQMALVQEALHTAYTDHAKAIRRHKRAENVLKWILVGTIAFTLAAPIIVQYLRLNRTPTPGLDH